MHGSDPSPGAHVSERCCCDSAVVGPIVSTSTVASRASTQLSTSLPVAAAVWSTTGPTRFTSPSQLDATRSAWPPNVSLYVLKSALLI
jgi:hypothetical protein